MKWLMAGFLICLVRQGSAGAIKCLPSSTDPECAVKEQDIPSLAKEDVRQDPKLEAPTKPDPVTITEVLPPPEAVTRPEVFTEPEVVSKPAVEDAECLAGSEWESQCFSCRCSALSLAECTRIEGCKESQEAKPIRCKPGSTFQRSCNTCTCLDNGLGLCTIKGCEPPASVPAVLPSGRDCAPWTIWKSQCNTCTCSEDGRAVCTEIGCLDQDEEPQMLCAPRSVWMNDCNKCWCDDRGLPSCTKRGCFSNVNMFFDDKAQEKDEAQIEKESQEEIAAKSNLNGAATKAAQNKTVVCVANRMFVKDCNTCWCNEDGTGFFCTRKVCVPELPEEAGFDFDKPEELRVIKRTCRPDEVFELDCNMCRCNPDGQSYSCTRRACLAEDAVPSEGMQYEAKNASLFRKVRAVSQEPPRKACEPGQEFRMDCNKCLCDGRGQDFSCTRIDCRAVNPPGGTRKKRDVTQLETAPCVPGSVFDQGCNVCRCNDDGKHATCTLKTCSKPPADQDELPESDPNFRCYPGEQFKRSCNDCSCSADGKSVFCTLRICDKDLSPNF